MSRSTLLIRRGKLSLQIVQIFPYYLSSCKILLASSTSYIYIYFNGILKLERLRICRDRDELLDNQSLRYEERLVELHSVIAELSRQLEQKARERIAEEEDDIDAENDADTSCENNSDICQTNSGRTCNLQNNAKNTVENNPNVSKSDVLSRTSTDVIDAEAVEVILL